MQYIKLFLITLPTLIVIDYVWVGKLMFKFYDNGIGVLARRIGTEFKPMVGGVFFVYIFLALGLTLFVYPKVLGMSNFKVFIWAALFGLITYAIYDLTNYSTLSGWTLKLSVADMLWGAFLCGITSVIVLALAKWLHFL